MKTRTGVNWQRNLCKHKSPQRPKVPLKQEVDDIWLALKVGDVFWFVSDNYARFIQL